KCVVRPSSCVDEDSLYRVAAIEKSQDKVRLSGNKIVNGREVNMGDLDCRYDAQTQKIECPMPNRVSVRFEISDKLMEGKMTMPDGTLWRKISLHKVEEK